MTVQSSVMVTLDQLASMVRLPPFGQAAAQEHQTGVGFGGIENETDRLAGMNANPSRQNDAMAEGGLKALLHHAFRLLVPLEPRDHCGCAPVSPRHCGVAPKTPSRK